MRLLALPLLSLALAAQLPPVTVPPKSAPAGKAAPAPALSPVPGPASSAAYLPKIRAIDRARMDLAVPPCADFVDYAMGRWMRTAEIPADRAFVGVDQELEVRNQAVLKEILEAAARTRPAPGSPATVQQKVGDFFASGMDEAAIEKAGLRVLAPELARIGNVVDARSLAAELARLHGLFVGAGFAVSVAVDDKDAAHYILALRQGGLGLPDRDYYLKEDPQSQELRDKYLAHVARMFVLAGDQDEAAQDRAKAVLALETRLAKASRTREELRDPQSNYHRMDVQALVQLAPDLDWGAYFAGLGRTQPGALNVMQPAFLKELSAAAKEVPLADWRSYLKWQVLEACAPCLPKAFEEESFAFSGQTLNGTPVQEPRWKRVLRETDRSMGEALGQLYVAKAFPPEAKAKALDLVKSLMAALRGRIDHLDWMGPATKAEALKKLDAMRVKIGYPDQWRDYSGLDVRRRPYLMNVLAARAFEFRRKLAQLGGPVDHGEWLMTAPTVNAYYEPTLNEICFPAGQLQAPYFDPAMDDAVNFGALGSVIGHELTHGFDDQGRQYDAGGNLRDWWTPEDAARFNARAALVVKQFDAFEPLPGLTINGKLTLGENLADLGGLKIAYEGWKLATAGKKLAPVDGFTPEQRFFLAYAESWRTKTRPEALRLQMLTNEHAPARWRVLGPLSNLPEFKAAFGCKDGDPLVRPEAERPAIW
ncbi:MAG TPA: M13 family metallopeptidase [Holophagaceae bacterium]|nr:M13 family metallopeptidase [Holophagaceae bacterium]